MIERTDEEYFQFLDMLRDSGVTNMYGASPYLESHFCIPKKEAHAILVKWMETFGERHQA